MQKLNEIINKNIIWLVMIIFTIVTLWLNSKYVSIDQYNELKKEFDTFKSEYQVNEVDVIKEGETLKKNYETIDNRLEKKIKILNELDDVQNTLENRIIILENEVKHLKK